MSESEGEVSRPLLGGGETVLVGAMTGGMQDPYVMIACNVLTSDAIITIQRAMYNCVKGES